MNNRETALQLLTEERDSLTRAINALQDIATGQDRMKSDAPQSTKRHFSEASRLRMAASQKARWAKAKTGKPEVIEEVQEKAVVDSPSPKKRTMSVAGRKRIAAAQKARWAKVKATATKKGKAPVEKARGAGG